MRLGVDAGEARLGKPEANAKRATAGRRKGSVVVTASVPETKEIPIESDQRNDERVRAQDFPLHGNGNIPHPPAHAHPRPPTPELDRRCLLDDDGKSHRPARLDMLTP